jgi:hypothetical protein
MVYLVLVIDDASMRTLKDEANSSTNKELSVSFRFGKVRLRHKEPSKPTHGEALKKDTSTSGLILGVAGVKLNAPSTTSITAATPSASISGGVLLTRS